MDFLTQQEVSGFRQDLQHGLAKQEVEKMEFERKLRETYAQEIKEMKEDPEKFYKHVKYKKFAKKYEKKKRKSKLIENLKKILGIRNENS